MNGVLREKRIMAGLTQKQVADRAGIALQQYQKFESGERNIMNSSFQIACRVIEALGMNISEFYHGEYTFGEKVVLDKEGLNRPAGMMILFSLQMKKSKSLRNRKNLGRVSMPV